MTKNKSTKRALFSSMLVMLICVAMLIGTTFAWFTDSVTSGKNQIVAGNLDIDLEYTKTPDVDNSWKSVEGKTDLFDPNALWEPGHTEVVYLKLTNKGNLAVKYQFGMTADDTVIGKNADGEDIKLSEHLMYGVVENQTTKFTDRAAAISAVGTSSKKLSAYSVEGYMEEKGDTKYVALVVYMPETVGNEANYRGDAVPTVELGVSLSATQYTYEADSFDNTYDANATLAWAGAVDTSWYTGDKTSYDISTPAQLAGLAKLVNAGNNMTGISFNLTADIDLANVAWTPIGTNGGNPWQYTFNGNFYGNGHTIYNLSVSGTTGVGLFGYAGSSAHIEGINIVNANVTGTNSVGTVLGHGYLAVNCLKNCNVENATVIATAGDKKEDGDKVGAVAGWTANGNIIGNTAKNCTVYGCRDMGGIVGYVAAEDRNVSVSGNTVSDVTLNVFVVDGYEADKLGTNVNNTVGRTGGSKTVTVESNNGECTINKGKAAAAASDTELDSAITNGATTVILGSGDYIIPDSAKGKTLTIIGNGDTVVASQDDGAAEGDCDYSFEGSTVTFENVTITTSTTYFPGYARMKGIYNNCTINGVYTLYDNSVFNNCTFNVSGDIYNVWTWGATTAEFNGCTFNNDGKALLLYGTANTTLTVNNCVFNDKGGLTDLKAAIEIGNDYNKSYNLIVNNTVVNGYEINDKGISTGTTLWANKNSMSTDKLNVVVDGVDVY